MPKSPSNTIWTTFSARASASCPPEVLFSMSNGWSLLVVFENILIYYIHRYSKSFLASKFPPRRIKPTDVHICLCILKWILHIYTSPQRKELLTECSSFHFQLEGLQLTTTWLQFRHGPQTHGTWFHPPCRVSNETTKSCPSFATAAIDRWKRKSHANWSM